MRDYSEILWQVNKTMQSPVERASIGKYLGANSTHRDLSERGIAFLPRAFDLNDVVNLNHYFMGQEFDRDGCVWHIRPQDILCVPEVAAKAAEYAPLAKEHLGAEPVLAAVAAFWTHPEGPSVGLNTWHRDRDDFRALKIFIYLTDVDEDSGPHQFIEGSHLPGLQDRFYIGNGRGQADMVDELLGEKKITITGPAGTTWAENTYGIHRGLKPTKRSRLVLEFLYTQNAYPEHRKRFNGFKLKDHNPDHKHLFQHIL